MGGIVSNNSTGSHSILYGMTTDHVLSMRVLLSDGTATEFDFHDVDQLARAQQRSGLEGQLYRRVAELVAADEEVIRQATPRHWRRCGGYNLDRFVDGVSIRYPHDRRFNLAKLVSGAEGTLAVMTDITLGLVPRPTMTALAIVHFDSLFTALTAVPIMLEAGPSAIELLDHLGLTMCHDVPEYARLLSTFVEGDPNCLLITEFYGESQAELRAKIDAFRVHLERHDAGAVAVTPAFDQRLQNNVWTVRKVGLGLMMSIKGDHKPIPFIEDAAVPVEHLAEYVTKVERFCNDLGANVAYYAHASAGCIHVRPLINTKSAQQIALLPEITSFSTELLHGYGGALSSEHGDGRARSWMNERFFGPELYRLFQEVKATFDPDNILNPGNIVNSRPMTENLRFGADYRAIPIQNQVDFGHELGFDRAIEMCNGAGVCRKKTTGTMCPSFMVTREEEHSTRGRANALRAAISGKLPAGALTSQRMYEVMDLCIECKACKAECPSSVDMAKIKTEFMAQYNRANGVPLRARLFANMPSLSRLSSGFLAPLANWTLRQGVVRSVLDKGLGIHRKRQLPPFARQPFTDWFKGRTNGRLLPADAPQVAFFHDTFNTYNYPQVSVAAVEVLEAAGFRIALPGHQCCGRPLISKGLLDRAKETARQTIDHLAPFAEAGIPIVGLEPSCLSALRDDYSHLLPDDPRVALVAGHTYGFEAFLAKLADADQLHLSFTGGLRRVLMHGHCHQKSLEGTAASHRALSLPAGYTVEEVDSGCCGMAGAFGYESEHYDISLKMAERRLLPAVRAAEEETIIVAAGVSCRQQILHGSGRQALHPAEVLRAALQAEG
jgi:Fe-S oxidoreductase/FAD/FMN-containing dehydrogenase